MVAGATLNVKYVIAIDDHRALVKSGGKQPK
jgi:hypothetical protein